MTLENLIYSIKVKQQYFEKDNVGKKSKSYIEGYMQCLSDILESIKERELDELF